MFLGFTRLLCEDSKKEPRNDGEGYSDTEIASLGQQGETSQRRVRGGRGNYKLQFTNYKCFEDAVSKLQITIYKL
ncbi:MAG: hypothetical protein FWG98_10675 [Candidatus Cloacimonetes bacterium]|nr:hypothetical protein [Candidatus Cloacimonadota bacterium]